MAEGRLRSLGQFPIHSSGSASTGKLYILGRSVPKNTYIHESNTQKYMVLGEIGLQKMCILGKIAYKAVCRRRNSHQNSDRFSGGLLIFFKKNANWCGNKED